MNILHPASTALDGPVGDAKVQKAKTASIFIFSKDIIYHSAVRNVDVQGI